MSKNNGGSAYPYTSGGEFSPGMTLRDYFAAQAMSGYIISSQMSIGSSISDTTLKDRAANFYRMADAMIAARK
ncbi:hypothetical protein [Pantoea ananatis]|uniref:hypothetical protein n=1 Tax=Pantoea ananas TaxID=553 RepID=UPI003C1A2DDD